jgi:hypothetical protein
MSIHSCARALGPAALVVIFIAVAAFASATPTLAQSIDGGGGGDGFCAGGFCIGGGAGTWLQDTINHIVRDFLSGLARDLGEAIVGSSAT